MPLSGSPITSEYLLLRLLAVLLLVLINAFFVATEFAIVYVRRSRISQLVREGDEAARAVQRQQQSLERLLSTTQLGITLASLALGWVGEATVAAIFSAGLQGWPPLASLGLSHGLASAIAFAALVYLQIVLGELCPKAVALLYPDQVARLLGPICEVIARIFNPLIGLLNRSTRLLLRPFGIETRQSRWYSGVSPEELQWIIESAAESTGLEADERELLSNVIEFGDIAVAEVMVPRTRLVVMPRDATVRELLAAVGVSGHGRFPVTGESLDEVVGIIDFRRLALTQLQQSIDLDSPIAPWIEPVHFVPESMPLSDLLPLMRQLEPPLAIVVDEFGGTEGLVTMQDLIAEILGEVESSAPDRRFRAVTADRCVVQAQTDIDTVNERLGLDLPESDRYSTLAGLVMERLQRLPQPGDRLELAGVRLTVLAVEGPRLSEIEICRFQPRQSAP